MNIARQYIQRFMSESAKKVVAPKRKSMRNESVEMPFFRGF